MEIINLKYVLTTVFLKYIFYYTYHSPASSIHLFIIFSPLFLIRISIPVFCPGYLEWWLDSNLHLVFYSVYTCS